MSSCPKCHEAMREKTIQTVRIDECPKCKGIWFDEDELRQAKDLEDPDLSWMDFEIWKHEDRFRVKARPLRCPRCDKGMVAVNYGETGVEVDFCPSCQGVWLDDREFGRILSALKAELASKSVGDYVKASLSEATELLTGRETFISEWKDLMTVLRFLRLRFFVENSGLMKMAVEAQRANPFGY